MKSVLAWLRQCLSNRPNESGQRDVVDVMRQDSRPAGGHSVAANRPPPSRAGTRKQNARTGTGAPDPEYPEDYEPTVPNLRILDDDRMQNDEVPGYDPYDTVRLAITPKQK